jgi:pyruvate kinase
LLIDDGAIHCTVTEKQVDCLVCRCQSGGAVKPRKGVNLPDSRLALPVLTAQDLTDLQWAIAQGLDYVALSFVREAADVDVLRTEICHAQGALRIVAKIETPAAVRNIDAVIERSDAILVARGDLGVEMDLVDVPIIQKDMVSRCRAAGVPVIVATQMLQSMVESPTPTRAEVSDVANAVLDGADAVMLSAETAIGKHATGSVTCMNRIIARTEAASGFFARPPARVEQPSLKVTSAVARTACLAAREHGATAIVVWTRTGNTARLISKHQLSQPILALAPNDQVCRRLALYAGVTPIRADRPADERALIRAVDREILARGLAQPSEMVVIVAGTDKTTAGASDAVILHFVDRA